MSYMGENVDLAEAQVISYLKSYTAPFLEPRLAHRYSLKGIFLTKS